MKPTNTLSAAVKKLLFDPVNTYPGRCCTGSYCMGNGKGNELPVPPCPYNNPVTRFGKLTRRLLSIYARFKRSNNTAGPPPACPYKTGDDCSLYYLYT